MKKLESTQVTEWVNTIRIATDADSPFRGMINLSEIFDLPISTQQKIFDALSDDTKQSLQELYGTPA